ncbi:got1/Sft2-like family domain-containing protein [Ditylenchus destructor]|uniref:Vesicle transport protein n=1 Tax=Ditylenchus destructor TaxID=166010 RepID=A0AAD4NF10_9BILA|nr:got1/Sft2-like family domain-containing protein [Ditylenchus destructor]
MFGRLQRVVNPTPSSSDPETQSQQGLTSEASNSLFDEITTLSWETRLYCFAGCFILSMICSILGSPLIFAGKLTGFAVMVSLGSVISIISTFFLSGPVKQLKKMFEPVRIIATLIYIVMIIFTLIAGLVLKNPPLALICIIGQYLAMAWYSLSYIPFARQMVSGCFGKICG